MAPAKGDSAADLAVEHLRKYWPLIIWLRQTPSVVELAVAAAVVDFAIFD